MHKCLHDDNAERYLKVSHAYECEHAYLDKIIASFE